MICSWVSETAKQMATRFGIDIVQSVPGLNGAEMQREDGFTPSYNMN